MLGVDISEDIHPVVEPSEQREKGTDHYIDNGLLSGGTIDKEIFDFSDSNHHPDSEGQIDNRDESEHSNRIFVIGIGGDVACSVISYSIDKRVGIETAQNSDEDVEEQGHGSDSISDNLASILISLEYDFEPDREIHKLREHHENSGIFDKNVDKNGVVKNDIKRLENATDSVKIKEKQNGFESGTECESALSEEFPVKVADNHEF